MLIYDGTDIGVRRGDVAAFTDEDGHRICGVILEIDPLTRRVLIVSDLEGRGQFVAPSNVFSGDAGSFVLIAKASTWVPASALIPLSAAGAMTAPPKLLAHAAPPPPEVAPDDAPPVVSRERPPPGGPDGVETRTKADKVEAAKAENAGSEPSDADLFWAVSPEVRITPGEKP